MQSAVLKAVRSTFVAMAMLCTGANAQERSINYLPDTIKSFKALTARFKDKVIYVDFWASWCAPCRQELRDRNAIGKVEAFALKHNIVILYVCGDKNDNNWKSFISQNKLGGYHVRLNPALRDDVVSRFSFFENRAGLIKKGFYIPRALIIDKQGIVVDSMAANPANPALYKRLGTMMSE